MITGTPRWSLKLTHEPTGIYAEVDSNHFRTQQEAKAAGIKLLKSKLYAKHLREVGDEILTSYIYYLIISVGLKTYKNIRRNNEQRFRNWR